MAEQEQTAKDIPYSVQETEQGRITGGIEILGLRTVSMITFLISRMKTSAIIKYRAVKAPSFNNWGTGVSNISNAVNVKIENGTAYAQLTIKMEYYTISTNFKPGSG